MADRKLSTEEYYRVLRPAETAKMVGYSTVHLARLEKAGLFPNRFPLNENGGPYGAKGHFFGQVVDYLKARAAARGAA
jgi:hypothetical protein